MYAYVSRNVKLQPVEGGAAFQNVSLKYINEPKVKMRSVEKQRVGFTIKSIPTNCNQMKDRKWNNPQPPPEVRHVITVTNDRGNNMEAAAHALNVQVFTLKYVH